MGKSEEPGRSRQVPGGLALPRPALVPRRVRGRQAKRNWRKGTPAPLGCADYRAAQVSEKQKAEARHPAPARVCFRNPETSPAPPAANAFILYVLLRMQHIGTVTLIMRLTALRLFGRPCSFWTLCPKLNSRNEIKKIKYIFIWGRGAEYVAPGSPRAPAKMQTGVPLRSPPVPACFASLAVTGSVRGSP
jgi:hypothetical protein